MSADDVGGWVGEAARQPTNEPTSELLLQVKVTTAPRCPSRAHTMAASTAISRVSFFCLETESNNNQLLASPTQIIDDDAGGWVGGWVGVACKQVCPVHRKSSGSRSKG